jgi:Cu(I)/Ag(I) efflux system membrane fusion protein
MKSILHAAVIALAMIPASAGLAADEAVHAGRGTIKSIDSGQGTLRLEHDPIASLKWPKMTMNFKAHDPALLHDLKPGTEVEFELMKFGSRYEIVRIAPAAD